MNKRSEIVAGAAHIFETEGFRGVGIDRVIAPSGASTRTLYKHFGSRNGLVIAVLEMRHHTFMAQLKAEYGERDPVGSLFDMLRHWTEVHGARGCLLLRARSEYAASSVEIVTLVEQQKNAFRTEVGQRVQLALGLEDAVLSTQIWLLLEGATASASVTQQSVMTAAKDAALSLLVSARARRA